LAIKQQIPQGPRVEQIVLEAPTAEELSAPGAVKQTHQQLAESKLALQLAQAELKAERQKSEGLLSRATTAETALQVLTVSIASFKHLALKVRLIEVVIVILLHYVSEASIAGHFITTLALSFACLVLVALIILIQRGAPPPTGVSTNAERPNK
jgi:hypothetical protein